MPWFLELETPTRRLATKPDWMAPMVWELERLKVPAPGGLQLVLKWSGSLPSGGTAAIDDAVAEALAGADRSARDAREARDRREDVLRQVRRAEVEAQDCERGSRAAGLGGDLAAAASLKEQSRQALRRAAEGREAAVELGRDALAADEAARGSDERAATAALSAAHGRLVTEESGLKGAILSMAGEELQRLAEVVAERQHVQELLDRVRGGLPLELGRRPISSPDASLAPPDAFQGMRGGGLAAGKPEMVEAAETGGY